MPASQQIVLRRSITGGVLAVSLGALALAVLFVPSRDPGTHALALQLRPSAELAGLLFVVALAALARPRLATSRGVAVALSLLVCATAASQPGRRGNPVTARPRPQPLLGSWALAVPRRARPRVGRRIAVFGGGVPRLSRHIAGDRRYLLDLAPSPPRPERPADCDRGRCRDRYRVGRDRLGAHRNPAARNRVRARHRQASRRVRTKPASSRGGPAAGGARLGGVRRRATSPG